MEGKYANYSLHGSDEEREGFMQLVERNEADEKSLYNNDTHMYEGPETLEARGLSYDEFVSLDSNEDNG